MDENKKKGEMVLKYSIALIATVAMAFAVQSMHTSLDIDRNRLSQELHQLKELEAQIDILRKYQDELNSTVSSIVSSSTTIRTDADVKKALDNLNFRLESHEDKIQALRQAIDPLRPDEVLTIARLKDSIDVLSRKISELEEGVDAKHDTFKSSVIRELDASSKATNWLFIVLIPLVVNLLYSIWKDRKQSRDKETSKQEA